MPIQEEGHNTDEEAPQENSCEDYDIDEKNMEMARLSILPSRAVNRKSTSNFYPIKIGAMPAEPSKLDR